jgi:hypothetical protein
VDYPMRDSFFAFATRNENIFFRDISEMLERWFGNFCGHFYSSHLTQLLQQKTLFVSRNNCFSQLIPFLSSLQKQFRDKFNPAV